jgi:hypothetical protein
MSLRVAFRAIAIDNTSIAGREEGALRAATGLATRNTQGASARAEGEQVLLYRALLLHALLFPPSLPVSRLKPPAAMWTTCREDPAATLCSLALMPHAIDSPWGVDCRGRYEHRARCGSARYHRQTWNVVLRVLSFVLGWLAAVPRALWAGYGVCAVSQRIYHPAPARRRGGAPWLLQRSNPMLWS